MRGPRDRHEQNEGERGGGHERHKLALARFRAKTYVAAVAEAPKTRSPEAAADVLRKAISDPKKPLTIADAAALGGMPLRDAEVGLHFLVKEYRGHLRVGEKGDLVFLFPHGFTQPWKTTEAFERFFGALGRGLMGVGRFVVRAWLMIVLVAYAAIFVALLIALSASNRDDRRGSPAGAIVGVLFRTLADALFWTFHPFSPFYVDYPRLERKRREEPSVPFYEKVNRFVFGPTPRPEDPLELERRVIAQIRASKGRVGLGDVMRATGKPREVVDAMMARLMLDYDGTVEVSEDGGIYYVFSEIRKTARDEDVRPPPPAWDFKKVLAPLTGNGAGANVLVALLNGFNLIMSLWALANHFTIANVITLLTAPPHAVLAPFTGTAIALGIIPLVMSALVFLLPIGRAISRSREAKKVARENARLAVLREVVERTRKKQPITDRDLTKAWRIATGEEPSSKEITREVVALGGDVDMQSAEKTGEVRYRFVDLETEEAALEDEREHATEEEKRVGRIVFASDN